MRARPRRTACRIGIADEVKPALFEVPIERGQIDVCEQGRDGASLGDAKVHRDEVSEVEHVGGEPVPEQC